MKLGLNGSRPRYLIKVFLICFAAYLFAGLIVGCSEVPEQKVIFRCIGGWSMPPSFHGNPYAAGGDGTHMHFVWDKLFLLIPETSEIIPRLAVSHDLSDDRTRLTIKLREDFFWHDGNRFCAKDVETTFLLRWAIGWGGPLERIEVPNDNEIIFYWRRPFSTIDEKVVLNERIMAPHHLFGEIAQKLRTVMEQSGELPIDPELFTEKHRLLSVAVATKRAEIFQEIFAFRPPKPVGTGAFEYNFVSASDLGLKKFPKHWDADKISIDEVRILRSGSNDITWAYLISGEIDAAHPATSQDVTEQILKLNANIRLILPSDYGEFGFILNHRKPPLSDINFRRALAHGINRDLVRMISYYYADTGTDYHTGVLQSHSERWLDQDFIKKLTRYDYNPQKAVEILKQAGYKRDSSGFWTLHDGTPFKFEIAVISGYSDWVLGSESLSNQLSLLGIRSQIRAFEPSLYHQQLSTGNFDIAANFGTDYKSYAHPGPSFDRYFSKSGYIRNASGIGETFNGYQYPGQVLEYRDLLHKISVSSSHSEIVDSVRMLAWAANENLPFLTMFEKKLMVFVVDGIRVQGWPDDDDPIWSASSAGLETVYSYLISTGRVRKADPEEPK